MKRYDHVTFDEVSSESRSRLQRMFCEIDDGWIERLSCSRSKSIAATKLDDAWMWLCRAIAEDQIERQKLGAKK